jgi:hypothetical protein
MLEAAKIVREAGGMVRLVESRLRPFGAQRASSPQRGAIAIVRVDGDGGEHFGHQAGGILLSGSVALFSYAGLIMPRLEQIEITATWKV